MTIAKLRSLLAELADGGMNEDTDHIKADKLLLKYIADKRVTAYFNKIKKWYA